MTIDKKALPNWLRQIRAILNREWDPIGQLASIDDMPKDEYETYADRIASMIHGDATDEQLLGYLAWAEVENMGLGKPFDQQRGERVIAALRALGPPPGSR